MLSRKDFLSLRDINLEEINYILSTAETMKYILSQKIKKSPHLQSKTVVTLFYESSLRSLLFFKLAAQYLSANVVDINVSEKITKGESLKDVANLIEQIGADFIIMRHPVSGAVKLLAENVNASVINAGDGINENPSQALLDLIAIKEKKGYFEGLKVAIVGDIINSRVAKSSIWGLLKLGAKISVAAPPTLIPTGLDKLGIKIYSSVSEALSGADVVMSVRLQLEKYNETILPSLEEYKRLFIINKKRMSCAKNDAIVIHSEPINRGLEIESEIIESEQCLLNNQISDGVAVRMALMYLLSKKVGGLV